jgi:hypothetical protein
MFAAAERDLMRYEKALHKIVPPDELWRFGQGFGTGLSGQRMKQGWLSTCPQGWLYLAYTLETADLKGRKVFEMLLISNRERFCASCPFKSRSS